MSTAIFAQERKPQMVGNDADKHGCRASAGYTWSQLKKECIRIFDLDIKMPATSANTANSTMHTTVQ